MILVATESHGLAVDAESGAVTTARGLADHNPTCLAADPWVSARAWCGTDRGGVFKSEDAGVSWRAVGLGGRRIMAVTASPAEEDVIWAGTEPSEVWRSGDGGATWDQRRGLEELPSSSEWSSPPKPHTHHVRWILCHPTGAGRLWIAIEAGALVSTPDGGRTWRDRVANGPYDTHEAAIHPGEPETLRVSARDGYYESRDGGATWSARHEGLDVGYLRSVAIDPGDPHTVVVSAASHPHAAYMAGSSDGRLYRRTGQGRWERVVNGWPDPPDTIAPLLAAGLRDGELWAADERGLHRTEDGGKGWRHVAGYSVTPRYLRGVAVLGR